MTVSLILAVNNSEGYPIGADDENFQPTLPWGSDNEAAKADMRRFKELTKGNTVVMGRTTYDSIGHALPDRKNFVITSRPIDDDEVSPLLSFTEVLTQVDFHSNDVFFIGGRGVYLDALDYVDRIYLTVFYFDELRYEPNTFVPEIINETLLTGIGFRWSITAQEIVGDENEPQAIFYTLDRIVEDE